MGEIWIANFPLVLASNSATRAQMLRALGLSFEIEAAQLDERACEQEFLDGGGGLDALAAHLACAKAREVSLRRPDALCLGADQTLTCDGKLMHKSRDAHQAEENLGALAGRTHRLTSAACFARAGKALFHGAERADMTMRALTREAIQRYLAIAGPEVLSSVGAYRIEELGLHLFERVEGAPATILGLPMFALLAWLRAQGALAL